MYNLTLFVYSVNGKSVISDPSLAQEQAGIKYLFESFKKKAFLMDVDTFRKVPLHPENTYIVVSSDPEINHIVSSRVKSFGNNPPVVGIVEHMNELFNIDSSVFNEQLIAIGLDFYNILVNFADDIVVYQGNKLLSEKDNFVNLAMFSTFSSATHEDFNVYVYSSIKGPHSNVFDLLTKKQITKESFMSRVFP
jgi:hypothetical protein